MSEFDLVVRGGTLVLPDGPAAGDVAVKDGAIAEVAPTVAGAGAEEVDATGLHVFPGAIDSHVHFDEPGRTSWEGFATGTAALAAGGATSFVDMPLNNIPLTLDAETFDVKLEAARASSLVDFGFWGGLTPDNLDKLDELAQRGAVGVKAFTLFSGIEEFGAADDLTLWEGMRACAELGLIVLVHAENSAIISGLTARARAQGRQGVLDAVGARPAIAEIEAIARIILMAEETGCALHVVHVSTRRGVELVNEARARGVDVTCETCPHYLLFSEDDVERMGLLLKSAPPPRSPADRDALWGFIADGSLPMVVSDHSPGPPELKVGDDYFTLWGGISGCQTTLTTMLAAGHAERGLPLETIAAITSRNVAKRFGLTSKGEIAAGLDADLALLDLSHEWVVTEEELRYRHPVSTFVGSAAKGRVVRTLVRGRTVYQDGEPASEAHGRLLTPDRARAGLARAT